MAMTLGYDERLRKQAALAAASTCVTLVFGLAFGPMMSFGVLPLFLVPVLMSAQFGRRRAGLIATAVSIPIAAFVFVPPAWSWAIGGEGSERLAVFAMDALLISWLVGAERGTSASPV